MLAQNEMTTVREIRGDQTTTKKKIYGNDKNCSLRGQGGIPEKRVRKKCFKEFFFMK